MSWSQSAASSYVFWWTTQLALKCKAMGKADMPALLPWIVHMYVVVILCSVPPNWCCQHVSIRNCVVEISSGASPLTFTVCYNVRCLVPILPISSRSLVLWALPVMVKDTVHPFP